MKPTNEQEQEIENVFKDLIFLNGLDLEILNYENALENYEDYHGVFEAYKAGRLKSIEEIKKLQEELNNSMNFHCPHFVTTDNGYVACNKLPSQDKLKEVIKAFGLLRMEEDAGGWDADYYSDIVKTFLESLGEGK